MSLPASTCSLVFLLLPGKINVFELKLGASAKRRMPGIDVLQARHSVSVRPVRGDKTSGLLRLINGIIHTNTLPHDLLSLSLSLTCFLLLSLLCAQDLTLYLSYFREQKDKHYRTKEEGLSN